MKMKRDSTTPIQHLFICGNNNFSQIDQLLRHLNQGEIRTDQCENNGTAELAYSNPCPVATANASKLRDFYCTWSQIWLNDAENVQACCYGYPDDKSNHFRMRARNVASMKEYILFQTCQDGDVVVYSTGHGSVNHIRNTDRVDVVASTENKLYGVKNDMLHECCLTSPGTCPELLWSSVLRGMTVSQVACGFEHTLVLSNSSVYSFGSSSRGQLGHGDVSVDVVTSPVMVDTLEGITIVHIAAGGWHSAAISDSGDLYIWGWNQHGQLGLHNKADSQTLTETPHQLTTQNTRGHEISTHGCVLDLEDSEAKSEDSTAAVRDAFTQDKGFTDLYRCRERPGGTDVQHSDGTEVDRDSRMQEDCNTLTKHDDYYMKNMGKLYTGEISGECAPKTEISIVTKCDVTSSAINPDASSLVSRRSGATVEVSTVDSVDADFIAEIHQDVGAIRIQPVPYGLDIPDRLAVKAVSCGSRHTCVVMDNGLLMTSGWNQYGQLCLGDTLDRDYLVAVKELWRKGERVIDVLAQSWNTLVLTQPNSSHT